MAQTNNAQSIYELGQNLLKQGMPQEAFNHFHKAAQLEPKNAEYWFSMGGVAMEHNNPGLAFNAFCQVLSLEPKDEKYIAYTVHCSRLLSAQEYSEVTKKTLVTCLSGTNMNAYFMGRLWLGNLKLDPTLNVVLTIDNQEKLKQYKKELHDPYVLKGLQKILIASVDLEQSWTALRKELLNHTIENPQDSSLEAIKVAMAHQCFLNEYVFAKTEEEEKYVQTLLEDIEKGDVNANKLATLAMYYQIVQLSNAVELEKKYKKSPLSSLIKQQISARLEEQAIIKEFVEQKNIEDSTSLSVQEMYEENPYPRWEDVPTVKSADIPKLKYLIAGCGTGRSTYELAKALKKSPITAIDLSRASLAYAIRKAKELNATNIDFHHMDILNVKDLNKTFDVINCGGVLHHMKDPMAGWQSLCDVLNKGGIMNIALYSKKARRHIIEAQKLVKEWGLSSSAEDIREFRQRVFALGKDHPAYPVVAKLDFYSTSICRDLCFHVQETCYDWGEIKDMLDALGLEMFRVASLAPGQYHEFSKMFPNDPKRVQPENWAQYEEKFPDTFGGMYQFWCKRKNEDFSMNPEVDQFMKSDIV